MLVRLQADLPDPLRVMDWSRKGDASFCLLFNLALEEVIRDSRIHRRGTIFCFFFFPDDIVIMERSEEDINKFLIAIKTAADATGSKVSEGKTKYMIVKGNEKQTTVELYITIRDCKFRRVHGFE